MISIRSNIMERINRPTYTDPRTGSRYWFKNNKYVEGQNKDPVYWGELHRVNGPAIESANGTKQWWLNDKRHRINGPAIEWGDGSKEWYLNSRGLSEEEFNAIPMGQRNNYDL